MLRHVLLFVLCTLPLHANGPSVPVPAPEPPCIIAAGEAVSIRDPRLRDPACTLAVGAAISLGMEEGTAPPERITRVRIEKRPACNGGKDEQQRMDDMTERAVAYLRDRGATGASLEFVTLPCAPRRTVDLVVVEVR